MAPTPRQKVLLAAVGVGMGVLLILLCEAAAWLILGPPPASDVVLRVDECSLAAEGDSAALRCRSVPNADVVVPRAKTRPRVVFLGGSSVRQTWGDTRRGDMATALATRRPDLDVINLGVPGMGAAALGRLADRLDLIDPDAVVIYSGHNEYSGTVFHGDVQGTALWALPLYRVLNFSWGHAALFRQRRGERRQRSPEEYINGIDDRLALDLRGDLDARFHHDLAQAIHLSPAPVVLCTLLRNPDWPPAGQPVAGRPECAAELQALARGPVKASAQRARSVCGPGPLTAWLDFRVARQEGRMDDARNHWHQSLDEDRAPLRAPSSADAIIREVAVETGAVLVDLEAAHGVDADPTWFNDMLHLSRQGNREVAEAVDRALGQVLTASPTR